MGSNPSISDTEMEVLKALWEHGPGTVRELAAQVGRRPAWAYTTILTLLQRLSKKGYVRSDKRGVAHIFRAAISREELLGQRLQDLSEELCEGTSTPLVQALVRGRRLSKKEVGEFRALLGELEKKGRRGRRKS